MKTKPLILLLSLKLWKPKFLTHEKADNLPLFAFLLLAFVSCKEEDETDPMMQIREIAYNDLSEDTKSTLIIDWREASVTKTKDGNYLVTFNTSNDSLLGPIGIIINTDTLEVIGHVHRF